MTRSFPSEKTAILLRGQQPFEWPETLRRHCDALRRLARGQEHDRVREQIWLLLHGALSIRLRQSAAHFPDVRPEDIEDIASAKALDLLLRAEQGTWDIADRSAEEIQGYLRTVARNGLVDLLRARGRVVGDEQMDHEIGGHMDAVGHEATALDQSPEAAVERREFARSLRECADRLKARSRQAWFFRVFYDFSTREIAEHPDIRLTPAHVDVILQRARRAISECMSRRGFAPGDMRPGTFAELWESFAIGGVPEPA